MNEDIYAIIIKTKSHRDELGRWHWNFERESGKIGFYPEWCREDADLARKVYDAHGVRPWDWICRKAGEILPELEAVLDRDYDADTYDHDAALPEDRFVPAVAWACRRHPDAVITVLDKEIGGGRNDDIS